MKKKYDFHINPAPLSSDDIAQHRDFDALMQAYEASPASEQTPVRSLRTYWGVAAAAALALLVGALLYLSDQPAGKSYEQQAEAHFAALPYVLPPLPELQTEAREFLVNANEGGVYEYETGSRLVVPSAAFETASGQLVEGEVSIRYREMHDFVDFYLAGIPMNYDSAKVRYAMESAGMVEVYAEQNGQPLRMRSDKTIEVELVSEITTQSFDPPSGYNVYFLDTSARNWVYSEVDRMQIVESNPIMPEESTPAFDDILRLKEQLDALRQEEQIIVARLEQSLPTPPRPIRHQPGQFVFDFDVDDLAQAMPGDVRGEQARTLREQHAGSLWQLAAGSQASPESLQKDWDNMELRPISANIYELTLIAANERVKVRIQPVLNDNQYELAMTRYQEELASYSLQMEQQRQAALSRLDEQRIALIADFEQSFDHVSALQVRHKVINRFQAKALGVWNCDRPVLHDYQVALASIQHANQQQLGGLTVYLANRKSNTVSRFLATEATPIRYLPEGDNILWALQPNGQLALIRPEAFREFLASADASQAQALVFEPVAERPRNKADLSRTLLSR